jgi:hypothetical protein
LTEQRSAPPYIELIVRPSIGRGGSLPACGPSRMRDRRDVGALRDGQRSAGLFIVNPNGLVQTTAFEFERDAVTRIYVVRNPDKLRHLTT